MRFKLGRISLSRLKGVHPDLVRVVSLAIEYTTIDFTVTEGLRSLERQRELFEAGKSKTMASKHLVQTDGFAHAVDVVATGDVNKDGYIDAQDKAMIWHPVLYGEIAHAFGIAAVDLDVKIRWGGDFKSFFDGPHFELVQDLAP